jgi:hypothetical protein
MTLPILLFILLLALLLWVTVRGQDAWPFSHYPMFSRLTDLSEIEVFRVALETTAGEITWWRSEFYRYPEFVGRMLKRLHQMESEGGRAALFAPLERQRYLAAVLSLIEFEKGRVESYRAFHIVRRTVAARGDNTLEIKEQTVARIPLEGINRIRRAD